ncbi:MAG TPA: glutamate mutase L, partial [Caldilineaceae bacterium]|nr:glutamate mutase L [Caldilineaceae bacterium]
TLWSLPWRASAGEHRLVGWLGLQQDNAQETPQLIANSCRRLGKRLGRTLWDEQKQEPLLESDDLVGAPSLTHVALSIAARPPLAVWLAGVSRSLSLAALESALAAAPVRVVGRTVLETTLRREALASALVVSGVEVLVVAGGLDDPSLAAQQAVLALCRLVGEALALVEGERAPAIFYAGNRYAAETARQLLSAHAPKVVVTVVENVQPLPDRVQSRELVRNVSYFDWRLSERIPGFSEISRWVTSPGQVASLAGNFAQLVRIWLDREQLDHLHAVYVTTAWRLHVLAERLREGLYLEFRPHDEQAPMRSEWPPAQLVSGKWPGGAVANHFWWDREGLAPIVGAVGQVAPLALVQVLVSDLFEPTQAESI